MSDLRELYQEVIIEHGRKPRNFHALENATGTKEGNNPLCGDNLKVYILMQNNKIADISFQGSGCAISIASASLMTEALKGKSLEEAKTVFNLFHRLVTEADSDLIFDEALGKLAVLAGVAEYPMRVKCATLAWHTMLAAAENNDKCVTTE